MLQVQDPKNILQLCNHEENKWPTISLFLSNTRPLAAGLHSPLCQRLRARPINCKTTVDFYAGIYFFAAREWRSTHWVTRQACRSSGGRGSLRERQRSVPLVASCSAGSFCFSCFLRCPTLIPHRELWWKGQILNGGSSDSKKRNKHLLTRASLNPTEWSRFWINYRFLPFKPAFKKRRVIHPFPLMFLNSSPGGVCLRCDRRRAAYVTRRYRGRGAHHHNSKQTMRSWPQ